MGFLRRLLGGGDGATARAGGTSSSADGGPKGADGTPLRDGGLPATAMADDEAARERELLREEGRRLSDDLLARQLRYADRSWTPPAQGGPRRADDPDADDA